MRKHCLFLFILRPNVKSFIITVAAAILCCAASCTTETTQQKAMTQVGFENVRIQDAFWSPRIENNALHTIPVCINQIENQTGRIRNFENAAKREGLHSGNKYDDSDVYKAVEGVAYSLVNHPNPDLEKKMDEWIDKFAAAQLEDGYLNTYYTLTGLENRWTDMDYCEMYCAGHLLEGAIAYYKATGKDKLLQVATRMVDYMMETFMLADRHWVPGHEEIELALCKLYALNGQKRYLDFAYWLLEQRGKGYSNLDRRYDLKQFQDAVPVKDLREIHGHAVRAMYLFCGMADVASYIPDTGYMEALDSLWEDVTGRRMYVTGGIGVAYQKEGFSAPYDLPNYEAYCETCASIGMVLWNHRMNEWKGDAQYANALERSLYNGVLAGISLQGDRFFYVNPLASHGDHHRQEWYGCACCPSNVCRFIPSVGSYIYGTSCEALWVNLYIGSEATCKVGRKDVKVRMETGFPWNGESKLTFLSDMKGQLRLRIPDWTEGFTLSVNGESVEYQTECGYAVVERRWRKGDVVGIGAPMEVKAVAADPRVKADEGQRAIQRGPLVYCAEQVDNPETFQEIAISEKTVWQTVPVDELGGITRLVGSEKEQSVNLIPYYAWDNREACEMRVWLPWKE